MRIRLLALLSLLFPASVFGDQIVLKGGARLDGVVVERREASVVIEVAPGRVTIPASRIDRIIEGGSLLASYRERAASLSPTDVNGWLALAQWAQERELLTQAHQAFEHVVSLDPANTSAQRALGRVLLNGDWVSAEESYRARGYVQYEGRWLTLAERDEAVREAAASAAARRERVEVEARAREAEAAARIAEAEARRAEAEAQGGYGLSDGIPYPWIFLGSPPVGHPGPGCTRPGLPTRPSAPPGAPVVQPPTRQVPSRPPAAAPVARGAVVLK